MPRLANTTDTRLRLAKPKLKEYRIGCGSQLFMRVMPSGLKYWQLRYYRPDGREALHQFGSYPAMTLANARISRDQLLVDLSQGKDPVQLKQVAKIARSTANLTFNQCAAAYVLAKQPEWKNAKHAQQWTNTLATYAGPVMGKIPVAAVSQDHVMACLQPIWLTKTETASRLRGRIEAVLDWAKVRGFRVGDNPAVWKGGLQSLLAAPNKTQQSKNHASMPYAQASEFMRHLLQLDGAGAKSLALVILTACRSGEVRLATWAEFKGGVWTIPAERMKAKIEHKIPLSKQAVELLTSLKHPQCKDTDFVFPGAKFGKPTSNMTMAEQLKRMGLGDFTVHGFRSTFRVWTAEQTNYPREVCEHALAHSLPNKVEAAYMRSDYLMKRQGLMQEWANFCTL